MLRIRIITKHTAIDPIVRVRMSRVFAISLLVVVYACIAYTHSSPTSIPSVYHQAWMMSAPSTPTVVRSAKKPRPTVKPPTSAAVCLAQNLYFEAAFEPYEALEAVAATVFNRINANGYPNTVCGVIYQKYQYSWTLDIHKWKRTPPASFVIMARKFLEERAILAESYPVTHFHRVDIDPKWAQTLTYVATFGQHKFYGM